MTTTNNKTPPLVGTNQNVLEREKERSSNLVVVGCNVGIAIGKSFFIFQNEYRKYIKMLKELLQVGRNQSTPKWILSKKVLASTMPPYTRSYQQKLKKNRCAFRSCLRCYEMLVLCQETNSSIEDDLKLQLSFFEIELVLCIPNSPHDNGLSLEFLLAQFVYHTSKQSKKNLMHHLSNSGSVDQPCTRHSSQKDTPITHDMRSQGVDNRVHTLGQIAPCIVAN